MIYDTILIPEKSERVYFTGKANHYMPIPRSEFLESKLYKTNLGDTLYSVSSRLFGDSDRNWPYVAENSRLKRPQDWQPNEQLNLPILILPYKR